MKINIKHISHQTLKWLIQFSGFPFRLFLIRFTIFLFIGLLFGCQKNICNHPFNPLPPPGYIINKIGPISTTENIVSYISDFQMVDATTGFALNIDISAPELHKTTDGGTTWTATPIPFAFSFENMLFTDKNTGYISHRGDDSGAFLLKTTDGGATWENIRVDGFTYFFNNLQTDNTGNLYARSGKYGTAYVVKSTDGGRTWTEIYASDADFVSLLTVQEDRIYFRESNADERLVILNLDGEVIKSLIVKGNTQLKVLDEDHIIVLDQYQATKTTDGGENWTVFFNNSAYVIDFSKEDGLIILLNKSYCGDDPNQLSAFALGSVSSESLEMGDKMGGFEVDIMLAAEKVGDGHFFLHHFQNIYELKKQ